MTKANGTKSTQPVYEALSIAKYLLSLDPDRKYFNNKKVTNRSIIKGNFRLNQLLYLLQISFHINDHRKLFSDDLYAWENGIIIYSIYTRFWELYLQKNDQETKDIEENDKILIKKRFGYLKDIPDKILQEFAHNDPAWSSTWAVSDQPKIDFTSKEYQETYQRFCSHWLQETNS